MDGENEYEGPLPGTVIGPTIRVGQFIFTLITVIVLMTGHFKDLLLPVRLLEIAAWAQCGWSLFIFIADMGAIFFDKPVVSFGITCAISVIDGIILASLFTATCLASGMVDFFSTLDKCKTEMHFECPRVEAAIVFGIGGWICILICFIYNLRLIARF